MVLAVFIVLAISGPVAWVRNQERISKERPIGGQECTLGVANGYVTADGRPLFWRVSDSSKDKRYRLVYLCGSPYSYLGLGSEGSGIYNGLNEAGLALGNSTVSTPTASTITPRVSPYKYILEKCGTVAQAREYIRQEINANRCYVSGCFPVTDAEGNAVIFEINRSRWFLEYDSMDPDRHRKGLLGFVVRSNEFHEQKDGTDDTRKRGRYYSGTYNVSKLIEIGSLWVGAVIQGHNGSRGLEVIRYGPGRRLATISRAGKYKSRYAMVIHGVAAGEDPALTTMWVILGQPNYGIAVPAWVKVSDIPECLSNGIMYDRAMSLYKQGNETITQACVFPVEGHMFEVVIRRFLPHWRAEGAPSVAEMTRIEHRMADDAYSLLNCLDNRQSNNNAPRLALNAFSDGLTVNFTVTANDPDGRLVGIEWNLGDGQISREISPSHTYGKPGTYLVSCTLMDDDGVTITDWKYVSLPPLR